MRSVSALSDRSRVEAGDVPVVRDHSALFEHGLCSQEAGQMRLGLGHGVGRHAYSANVKAAPPDAVGRERFGRRRLAGTGATRRTIG